MFHGTAAPLLSLLEVSGLPDDGGTSMNEWAEVSTGFGGERDDSPGLPARGPAYTGEQ